MKKQINPTINAHLIRGAFYLLLLIAVCAIPFALAQRNSSKHTAMRAPFNYSQVPKFPYSSFRERGSALAISAHAFHRVSKSTSGVRSLGIPPYPKAPQGVLYDQYDNASDQATVSAMFSDFATFSSDLADDFVVPAGQTWNVQSIDADGVYLLGPGPADSFNVFFYTDNAGLPGTQVYSATNQPFSVAGSTFTVTLPSPAVLTEGTYWVEIQGNMTFGTNGAWFWTDRTVQSNSPAAWQNPGGGLGVCPSWGVRTTCVGDEEAPDQVFRLNGTAGGVTPTPTPTASPTPTATATATATPVPGCGLLVGDGLAVGFAPNNFTLIASNIVNFTFSNSQTAPNDFAIFQTHDPFGSTVVEDAITAAAHTFSVFTPGDLSGFDFTQYRVIVLNWDDHFVSDFIAPYTAAIPALEAYISSGGVVWVQGAIQSSEDEDSYPLPFGGESSFDLSASDPIVDPSNPMVQGVPNPITGNFASQASDEDLPGDADVVVVKNEDNQRVKGGGEDQSPVLYDLFRGSSCQPTPTPSPSPTTTPTATATATASPTPTATATASPTPTSTATPTPTGTPVGCVSGQGFWRNHPNQWPVTQLQLGNITYNQQQLLSILQQSVRGNGLVLLARQEIVAKLNIANGADGSCIQQTLADADAMIGNLVVPPVGTGFLSPSAVSADVETLGEYNDGDLCVQECEEDSSPSPSPSEHPRPPGRQLPPRH